MLGRSPSLGILHVPAFRAREKLAVPRAEPRVLEIATSGSGCSAHQGYTGLCPKAQRAAGWPRHCQSRTVMRWHFLTAACLVTGYDPQLTSGP